MLYQYGFIVRMVTEAYKEETARKKRYLQSLKVDVNLVEPPSIGSYHSRDDGA